MQLVLSLGFDGSSHNACLKMILFHAICSKGWKKFECQDKDINNSQFPEIPDLPL